MFSIGHRLVYCFDDYGQPFNLVWDDGRPVYFDELNNKFSEISQKYANYKKCKKPKMFNSEQVKHIKVRRADGASLRQIAKEMNCSEGTIRNYLKES